MKPATLAAELGKTPSHLHRLCETHNLPRRSIRAPRSKRETWDFPPETVATLRAMVGDLATRAAIETLAVTLHLQHGSVRRWESLGPEERKAVRSQALRLLHENSATPLADLRSES